MAATTEGLGLGAFTVAGGRWSISWEELDAALWAEVEGLQVNGVEAEVEVGP